MSRNNTCCSKACSTLLQVLLLKYFFTTEDYIKLWNKKLVNNTELDRTYSHKEYAKGSTSNRGIFGTKQDAERLIGKKDCYTSAFDHSVNFLRYYEANGNSTAGYKGKVRFSFLAFDIDSDDLNESLNWTRDLIKKLEEEYEVNTNKLRYYFSGSKGFHIEIPSWMIDVEHQPSSQYPYIFKAMVQELTEHADLSLYQTIRLYRLNNTINSKTGLYKIELSLDEIKSLPVEEIKELAGKYRFNSAAILEYEKVKNEKLVRLFSKYLATHPDYSTEQIIKANKTSSEKIEISRFDKIVSGCSHIKSLVEKSNKGENLNNQERVVLANLLSRFGEEGRSKLHEILGKTPHYSREKTDYHLDLIIKHEYHPVSCEMICGNTCKTVKLLNRTNCLSLAYVSEAKDFIQTYAAEKFIKYRTDIVYAVDEDKDRKSVV